MEFWSIFCIWKISIETFESLILAYIILVALDTKCPEIPHVLSFLFKTILGVETLPRLRARLLIVKKS